ncbi:hypothetical protein [Ruegeria atlantica]|uniref:hypothetical protein n=1 Tax=Ruegeria atlantica TaxID=81569 RepID=UPI00147A66F1|nr:hypothetical protein [Ruegeria atlantica]
MVATSFAALPAGTQESPIQHDAEFFILQTQHGPQWVLDDAFAALRDSNNGKTPKIDNISIGDMGIPEQKISRHSDTPWPLGSSKPREIWTEFKWVSVWQETSFSHWA